MTVTKPVPRMNSWAARGLTEEIAQLREDVHHYGEMLKRCEVILTAVYADLYRSNRAQLPQ